MAQADGNAEQPAVIQMNMKRKQTVAVIFGGRSSEHPVSLQSAYAVISHLDPYLYDIVMIGITREGEWYRYFGDPDAIAADSWLDRVEKVPASLAPSPRVHGLMELHADGIRETRIDVAFPVLHGKNGEDGTIQGLIELAGIPLVGCGTLPSALCMDKDRAHKLAARAGIQVPNSVVLEAWEELDHGTAASLRYPLFVKPVRAGSSFGITKIHHEDQLAEAVALARSHDDRVIVEEMVEGVEVGCAVLGNGKLIIGEVDEIELADGFFDYNEKYTLATSKIHMPARIEGEKAEEIKQTAERIFRALGCSGYARIDMFLTPTGEIVFNEANTIPGFTAHSRFPSMLRAAGWRFEDILDQVIGLAV